MQGHPLRPERKFGQRVVEVEGSGLVVMVFVSVREKCCEKNELDFVGTGGGELISFFGTLNGRMIEQEFFEDGGGM